MLKIICNPASIFVLCLLLIAPLLSSCFAPEKSYYPSYHQFSEVTIPENDKSFIAMEYYLVIWNRRMRVYITDERICVGKVGGAIASTLMIDSQWYVPSFYEDPSWEEKYKNIVPCSLEFLSISMSNFQIKRTEISKVEYNPEKKWGMGGIPHSGRIIITTKSGREYEFILLGNQNGNEIVRLLLHHQIQ